MHRHAPSAAVTAGALTGAVALLLRRMEREYAATDTLSPRTVAAMYGTYGAVAAALVAAARRRTWPVPLPGGPSRTLGTAVAGAGAVVAVAGARPFGAGRQISGMDAGSLHTGGIYRYSRNPQYLGLGLAATGVALASRSTFAALLAAGVWAAYRRWIPNEERHLARAFGGSYRDYRARVRRWLGRHG